MVIFVFYSTIFCYYNKYKIKFRIKIAYLYYKIRFLLFTKFFEGRLANMNKDKKRFRSTKEQINYQQRIIREKLEEFLQNPYPHSFLTFFEKFCEYCSEMSQEESIQWGKKFISYKDKDTLRNEQDRFQKTLKKIGYKRESKIFFALSLIALNKKK